MIQAGCPWAGCASRPKSLFWNSFLGSSRCSTVAPKDPGPHQMPRFASLGPHCQTLADFGIARAGKHEPSEAKRVKCVVCFYSFFVVMGLSLGMVQRGGAVTPPSSSSLLPPTFLQTQTSSPEKGVRGRLRDHNSRDRLCWRLRWRAWWLYGSASGFFGRPWAPSNGTPSVVWEGRLILQSVRRNS